MRPLSEHKKVNNNISIIMNADNQSHKCEYCSKCFKTGYTLSRHTRTHTGEKPFQCEKCDKKFSQSGHLRDHARVHSGEKPFVCNECGKTYFSATNLKIHSRVHTGEKPYMCHICPKKFTQTSSLKFHLKVHAGEIKRSDSKTSDNNLTVKKYVCKICSASFKLMHTLKVHLFIHSGEKPFTCDICSKAFAQSGHLKQHMNIHSNVKEYAVMKKKTSTCQYRCNECGAFFSGLGALKSHAGKHSGKKPYKCGICQRGFTSQFFLSSHVRTHTGEKPYQCDVCSKSFSRRSVLICHLKNHVGDKRYRCQMCDKKFISSSDLTKHIRIHTGEKPYKCEFCSSCFNRSSHLTRHTKIHFVNKKEIKRKSKGIANHNTPSEVHEKVLSNTNLMTDQNGLIEFNNIPSITSFNQNEDISVQEKYLHLNNSNGLLNTKYHDLSFETQANDTLNIFEDLKYEQLCSLEKSNPSDSMKKFAIVKNTSKWLNHYSNCHLKSSCEEVKLQIIINCNPWQCGLCDVSFSQQSDLTTHIYSHTCDGVTAKYTKLVKNPKSGIHELKEIVPRKKLQIVSRENLEPIIKSILGTKFNKATSLKPKKIFECNFEMENNIFNKLKKTEAFNKYNMNDIIINTIQDCTENISINKEVFNKNILSNIEKDVETNMEAIEFRNEEFITTPRLMEFEINKNKNIFTIKNITEESQATDVLSKSKRKKFSCHKCLKIFRFSYSLNGHNCCYVPMGDTIKTHIGKKLYKCTFCKKQLKSKIGLRTHQNIHTGETPYKCEYCGKGFRQPSSLTSHLRTHTGERPFGCQICGNAFTQKSTLTAHIRTHTGERPYQCNKCQRSFPSQSDLKKHYVIHSNFRPYVCNFSSVCNKSFYRNSNLQRHMNTHRKVNCD